MKKPKTNCDGMACCSCSTGHFRLMKINYITKTKTLSILVPNIWVEICDSCGEMLFSGEVSEEIEKQIMKVMPNYFRPSNNPKVQAYARALKAKAMADKSTPTIIVEARREDD